jgi:L-threonylcarbamoyladenylate synthase
VGVRREAPLTEIIRVDRDRPNPDDIARAADRLRRGGLVAFPTETVYGLGVHALDRDAVRRLFEAKGRPASDPLIVHVADVAQIAPLVSAIPTLVAPLAARFWPGPLTLVMPRSSSVPPEVTAGLPTVAIRVPAHPVAHALLAAAGIPVAAPSANLFSRPSPTRASHVLDDLNGRIDVIVDGGATDVGVESTVVDITVDPPELLRPGAVTLEQLRELIPSIRTLGSATSLQQVPSPGLLPTHYAPRTPLTLFRGDATAARQALRTAARDLVAAGRRVGVVATEEDLRALDAIDVTTALCGADADAAGAAATLYDALRTLDASHLDAILVREPAREDGLWRALRDRLRRGAATIVEVT